jgi:peptide deformylase
MALLKLHLLGSPVLRQRSGEVSEITDEVRQFIADMFATMDAARGVGLAANQVGVDWRVAVGVGGGTPNPRGKPQKNQSEWRATQE